MKKQTATFDPTQNGIPSAEWIEKMFLGIAMNFPGRMDEIAAIVRAEDFSTQRFRLIWKACLSLHESGAQPQVYSVAQALQRDGVLESVEIGTLIDITEPLNCPNLKSIDKYAQQLRDATQRRRALLKCNDVMLRVSAPDCDTADVLLGAEESFSRLSADLNPDSAFKSPSEILAEAGGINAFTTRGDSAQDVISTPFGGLNRLIPAGGFQPGDLVVMAGHTGRGKTALALNLAMHAARHGKPVAFVSLEMPESQIHDRMICYSAEIDMYRLRRKDVTEDGERERREKIRGALAQVAGLPIRICYAPGITVKALYSDLRRMQARHGLGMVVVDYLQLMGSNGRSGSRAEEVSGISRGLKRMAGELGVPVIALSQFSRESAKENREPRLDDLRESGSIEQDATLVLFVHFTRLWDMRAGVPTGDAKLILAKQRNGATTWLTLKFHAPTGRFYEEDGQERMF